MRREPESTADGRHTPQDVRTATAIPRHRFPGHLPLSRPIELPAEYLWCDSDRLGGTPCFRGTRVPVDALFGNLEDGMSLDEFLDAFEGVTREQVAGVLEAARAATHGVPTM